MGKKSLFLVMLLLLIAGCSTKEKDGLIVSDENINMSMEGGDIFLKIGAESGWKADHTANWFHLSTYEYPSSKIIRISIDPNIDKSRSGDITITTASGTKTVKVAQLGGEPGAQLQYKIPVIFHVLYNDINNPKQNIPYDYIVKALETVNNLYRNAGEGSPDMKVTFVMAEKDPQGVVLTEPGVVRERWLEESTDAIEFMNSNSKGNLALIWDPNKYINIMLYNFNVEGLLGISTFPLVPQNHPLKHLEISPKPILTIKDIDKVRCVSINSLYMDQQESIQHKNVNNDAGITLSHELGHYLGLRHTFSEKSNPIIPCQDSDNCSDTPTYNRTEYNMKLEYIFKLLDSDPQFKSSFDVNTIFYRDDCDGTHYLCRNIMDYDFCTSDYFSPEQWKIVRHVLRYSPFIPGPKVVDAEATRSEMAKRYVLPHTISECPISLSIRYKKLLNQSK